MYSLTGALGSSKIKDHLTYAVSQGLCSLTPAGIPSFAPTASKNKTAASLV